MPSRALRESPITFVHRVEIVAALPSAPATSSLAQPRAPSSAQGPAPPNTEPRPPLRRDCPSTSLPGWSIVASPLRRRKQLSSPRQPRRPVVSRRRPAPLRSAPSNLAAPRRTTFEPWASPAIYSGCMDFNVICDKPAVSKKVPAAAVKKSDSSDESSESESDSSEDDKVRGTGDLCSLKCLYFIQCENGVYVV
ncbi:uncharacterized protein A4U43_UnF130 [Asparagus officinalis]|uniref:Uncharacterized protein n=1 Tax=Asparagus officinalis TaxID=4686 RepID=A0A1R3L7V6_ASPOF|nr:uncharacterized protein A4U43_UnF130 [Asparagus officinalis]